MATPKAWWTGRPEERFWLESTDRADIGVDLRAPLADDSGEDNWRYTLFREARVGDIVFHYDKRESGITSVSRVAGNPVSQPIVWAARGSYARDRGAEPTELDGYAIPLSDHQNLATPLLLDALRADAQTVRALYDDLKAEVRGPLYFPFELSDRRPIRPLQGYAFKLPAAFVSRYPALADAVNLPAAMPTPSLDEDAQRLAFDRAIVAIEAAAPAYAMGGLQALRRRLRGLKRTSRTLFSARRLASDWAFHHGGRNELQFNIGLDRFADGAPAFRAGVAFSFEPSRSLPDIQVLVPKVARFNAWMREHPEALSDHAMWHYDPAGRSSDYPPGPIPLERVRPDTFVFLGRRQPIGSVDPHTALRDMDALLPLYEWVESGVDPLASVLPDLEPGPLQLGEGRALQGGRWITATTRERQLDIYLRHVELQRRLRDALMAEGCTKVVTEARLGSRSIDVAADHDDGLVFYEVKTAATVRACLREAIGQLLEYALWSDAHRPARLVVVGEPPLDETSRRYLARLNAAFPVPLSYRQVRLDD